MKNIILFDLDGTLTDPRAGMIKSIQYALSYFNVDVENIDKNNMNKFIGPPIRWSFKELFGFADQDIEKAVEKYREYYVAKGLYENDMYDGIDILLKKLNDSGKTLIVATSKATDQAHEVLRHFGIDKYFSFISGAELNGDRSEKNELILYAFEKNNIHSKDDCIMVGDRKYDIIGAKTVGIKSIGVLYGFGSYEELTDAGADYIVKDVEELSSFFNI